MKKAILVVVLAAVSCGAWAQQWVKVVESGDASLFYIDPATIRKDGHLRRFWSIQDLSKPDKDGDKSYRVYWEMDCKEARQRSLQTDFFRGPMATGERSGGFGSPGNWVYVAPGTVAESNMKFVC